MKVVITGTSGFLGGELKRHYEKRGDIVIPIRLRPTEGDRPAVIADLASLIAREQPTVILNAGASQNGKDDVANLEELLTSNVLLPAALASLIKEHSPHTRLVNFGSSWQIGENGEMSPFNSYAASKSAAEPFFEHFAQDGLRIATLRLYDTYGPTDKRRKIVNLIADALIKGSELPMSSGGQVIDLVHIDDVLAAVDSVVAGLLAEPSGAHRIYAVRSGTPTTILQLLELMTSLSGKSNANIQPGAFPYRARERFALFEGTKQPPGWIPRVSLEQGLRQVLTARQEGLLSSANGPLPLS